MSDTLTLNASLREGTGKGAARAARRNGLVPGVIYGDGKPPVSINIPFNDLLKHLKNGNFKTTLVDLKAGDETHRVICRDVQRNVVKDLPTHVDFLRLSPRARINLFIPVTFVGQDDSPGLTRGGTLVVVRNEVELNVRATEIPSEIVADVSALDIGDSVHISHVSLPEGAKPVIDDRDFAIANISAPSSLRSEEDEAEEGAEEAATEESATEEGAAEEEGGEE